MEKGLFKKQKNERLKGVVLGMFLPVILLLILGLYGFFISKPWVVGENSFAVAPTSYFGVVWVYLVSLKYKYHVLSCLSGNILAVLYLTRKNKNSMANGMILPTAVYAVVLVTVRLL